MVFSRILKSSAWYDFSHTHICLISMLYILLINIHLNRLVFLFLLFFFFFGQREISANDPCYSHILDVDSRMRIINRLTLFCSKYCLTAKDEFSETFSIEYDKRILYLAIFWQWIISCFQKCSAILLGG